MKFSKIYRKTHLLEKDHERKAVNFEALMTRKDRITITFLYIRFIWDCVWNISTVKLSRRNGQAEIFLSSHFLNKSVLYFNSFVLRPKCPIGFIFFRYWALLKLPKLKKRFNFVQPTRLSLRWENVIENFSSFMKVFQLKSNHNTPSYGI